MQTQSMQSPSPLPQNLVVLLTITAPDESGRASIKSNAKRRQRRRKPKRGR